MYAITLLSIPVMIVNLLIYRKYCCNGLLSNPKFYGSHLLTSSYFFEYVLR